MCEFNRKWFKNFNVQNFTSNLTRLNSLSLNFYLNEFQKSSLVQLEFTNTNFSNVSLKNFRNLYNLKYLRFEKCEANNIPINISEISIYIYFRNSNKFLRFKEFLENCHNGFKIINLNHIIELEFLKIVLNYIERSNGILKIFGMLGLDKELNDEELKLLNQIKDKGVKIVDSYSFHSYY
ncbi:hypothetical protein RhiirA4_531457 [Rhizophagus irregularis]|uniref:Uncharacterized protein n=1 Tax=Rhizophagus irregularis TaxID=588596 RepID=A0A2I1GW75_9GLOM|nr:hypothetical protein RhiirA4_531457 [Rhizophagus irregularis]